MVAYGLVIVHAYLTVQLNTQGMAFHCQKKQKLSFIPSDLKLKTHLRKVL